MTGPDHILSVETALLSSHDLDASGVFADARAAQVARGELIRVARGWYVPATTWKAWFPTTRHLSKVVAAHRNAETPPLFSHHSAAALLGLPLWGIRDEPVHTISKVAPGRAYGLMRHRIHTHLADIGSVSGYRCTSPEQTIVDLSRMARAELVAGAADAAIRFAVGTERCPDPERVEAWRAAMRDRIARRSGQRGIRLLRQMIEFADPRADSPLESVSRLHLHRLGFELDLQVRVPQEHAGYYDVDFELLGLGIFGESDGDMKYTDPSLRGDQTSGETVLREKKRDNWISGSTGNRMIHWGTGASRTIDTFATMLQSFNVPLPRLRRHI